MRWDAMLLRAVVLAVVGVLPTWAAAQEQKQGTWLAIPQVAAAGETQGGANLGPPASGEGAKRDTWLAMSKDVAAAESQSRATTEAVTTAPSPKGPPLPFHTVEGVSGACITPMAYMANAGQPGTIFSLPSASFTYLNAGRKNVEALAVTEVIYRRIEFGYALDRLGMGSLPADIKKATGIDIDRNDVLLHNFNLRGMLVEENSFNLPLPAVTAGVDFKYNDGVRAVDNRLHGALTSLGFRRSNGADYTLTASKMLPIVFGRPVIVTAGLRNSEGAQAGFLGFGDRSFTTFEGSVVYLPTDWLAIGYEYRQKPDPYGTIGHLVGQEDDWQTICVGLIYKNMTLCVGWARLGTLVNSEENGAWAIQFKYEF